MSAAREYVHHVDRDDRVIGKVSRDEAHQRGLLHRSGCVVIRNAAGEVFLARRARTKAIFAGCWDWACSFHVSWGETYDEAATRELLEETGIRGAPTPHGAIVVDQAPDHLIVRAYTLTHDGPLRLDPAETESGAFVNPDFVDKILRDEVTTSWLGPTWALIKRTLE